MQGDLIAEEGRFPSIIENHIPLNRLARENEFNGAILFLISDAGGFNDQKNSIKQIGIIIKTAAANVIQ